MLLKNIYEPKRILKNTSKYYESTNIFVNYKALANLNECTNIRAIPKKKTKRNKPKLAPLGSFRFVYEYSEKVAESKRIFV